MRFLLQRQTYDSFAVEINYFLLFFKHVHTYKYTKVYFTLLVLCPPNVIDEIFITTSDHAKLPFLMIRQIYPAIFSKCTKVYSYTLSAYYDIKCTKIYVRDF